MKQVLFGLVVDLIKTTLVTLFRIFKKNNTPETYENVVQSIRYGFTEIKKSTERTQTKVDDTLVDVVLEALKEA